jgi:hypothetical protein
VVRRRGVAIGAVVVLVAAALAYLRDPAWLATQTTGMREWREDPGGFRWRWTSGHASFFVPSDARAVRLRLATSFDATTRLGDRPMLVTFTIDDRRAARLVLSGPGWQTATLELPPPGNRRVRRVDLHTSITRAGNHGVQIGEPEATTDGQNWRRCCFSER